MAKPARDATDATVAAFPIERLLESSLFIFSKTSHVGRIVEVATVATKTQKPTLTICNSTTYTVFRGGNGHRSGKSIIQRGITGKRFLNIHALFYRVIFLRLWRNQQPAPFASESNNAAESLPCAVRRRKRLLGQASPLFDYSEIKTIPSACNSSRFHQRWPIMPLLKRNLTSGSPSPPLFDEATTSTIVPV